jgi:hypothetical protein
MARRVGYIVLFDVREVLVQAVNGDK